MFVCILLIILMGWLFLRNSDRKNRCSSITMGFVTGLFLYIILVLFGFLIIRTFCDYSYLKTEEHELVNMYKDDPNVYLIMNTSNGFKSLSYTIYDENNCIHTYVLYDQYIIKNTMETPKVCIKYYMPVLNDKICDLFIMPVIRDFFKELLMTQIYYFYIPADYQ